MDFKLLGSVLLIVGTSLGAGMLGLPIATAQLGFTGALVLLVMSWFVMMMGALLLLEVNLWLPQNNNIISMAGATIGPLGQIIAWLTYLLLLYSLLCAYIAGGSDLFRNLLLIQHIDMPMWMSSTLFTLFLGTVVYFGIRSVDYVNRGLMFVKFGAYFLLVMLLIPLTSSTHLFAGDWHYMTAAAPLTVSIAAFGYATIVPSLRVYFAGDIKKLKKAIIIGSTIPLFCYIAWDIAIMGVIPLHGEHSMVSILQSENSTSDLVNTLNFLVEKDTIKFFVKLFTSICVLTSFLGVALCLTDFFADGLQMEKKGRGNVIIHAVTFLPPLIVVLFFPHVFIKALEYAGIYSVILLILLPACMAWCGRYNKYIARGFKVSGGKGLLVFLVIFSLAMVIKGLTG